MPQAPVLVPGWQVSSISFGAWAIGAAWGSVDDADSLAALHRAVESDVPRHARYVPVHDVGHRRPADRDLTGRGDALPGCP